MGLDKMLEYQKIDMGVYRMEKEYNQSKELGIASECKRLLEEKKEALRNLRAEFDDALSVLEKIREQVENLSAEKAWESYDLDSIEDQEELAEIGKEFSQYEENFNNLSKNAAKIIKKLNDIEADNRRLNAEINELIAKRRKASAILEARRTALLEKIKPIAKQLGAIKQEIDDEMFKVYTDLRKAKKMPAFVPYNGGNCGACGMEILIEVGGKLVNKGDMAECPHCGRIVFVP